MELYQLAYFQAVAEAGTLRAAAARLSVSQSAVSRAIALLEAEIGVELFTRRGRANELNRYGREFLQASQAARRGLDGAVAGVRELAGADDGTVAVGFLHSLGLTIVPELIRHHHVRFPRAQFALRQRSGHLVLTDLLDGDTDVCLSHPTAFGQTPGVTWNDLFTQRLYLVVGKDHRLAARRSVRFDELAEEQFVALDRDHTLRRILDDACARHGFTATIAFEGTDVATLRGLIGARLGVSILPRMTLRQPDVVEIAVDDPELVRPIAMGWVTDRYLPPAAASFRDTAVAAFADDSGPAARGRRSARHGGGAARRLGQ